MTRVPMTWRLDGTLDHFDFYLLEICFSNFEGPGRSFRLGNMPKRLRDLFGVLREDEEKCAHFTNHYLHVDMNEKTYTVESPIIIIEIV